MKEAAGEANMTVITIVLIGVVAAVGLLLVPRLMKNIKAKACCTDGGGYMSGVYCVWGTDASGKPNAYQNINNDKFKTGERFSACMAD